MEDKYAPLGGQAVVEGVLMRSPDTLAVAVRKPSNQEIILETIPVKKNSFSSLGKIPFFRGVMALVQSMQIGFWALNLSADIVMKDIDEAEKAGKNIENIEAENSNKPLKGDSKVSKYVKEEKTEEKESGFFDSLSGMTSILISVVLTVGLFMVLPASLFNYLKDKIDNVVVLNLIEGSVRLTIFVLYIVAISMFKDVKRLFQYHGAEHKTIHSYEAKEDLTVENARKHSPIHPRCGTNFLFLTAITSIVLFSLLGKTDSIAIRVVSKLSLLPFVAGISYELIRIAGQIKTKPNNLFVRIAYFLSTPGMIMQKLTTREPDDSQLEVALVSLKATLNDKSFEPKSFQESLI